MDILIPFLLLFFSCLVIWRTLDGLQMATDYLGRNLSEGFAGWTVYALTCSSPALLVTMIALFALDGPDGFAVGIGITAGSALFNVLIIPAVCMICALGTSVNGKTEKKVGILTGDMPRQCFWVILSECLLLTILFSNSVHWYHGLLLLFLYAVFLHQTLSSRPELPEEESEDETDKGTATEEDVEHATYKTLLYWFSLGPLLDLESQFINEEKEEDIKNDKWNAWPLLITSVAICGSACYLLVIACGWLSTGTESNPYYVFWGTRYSGLGLPPFITALVFGSLAILLPDLIVSIRDAKKGHLPEILNNSFDTSIFDTCFTLGFPLLLYGFFIKPVELSREAWEGSFELRLTLIVLLFLAFLLYFVGHREKTGPTPRNMIGKNRAYALLGLVAVFIAFAIV